MKGSFTPTCERQRRVDGVRRPKFDFHTDVTMLMLGFDCAARMTRRPMRPKPLMPTRIDIFVVPAWRWVRAVARRRTGVIFGRRGVAGVSACFLSCQWRLGVFLARRRRHAALCCPRWFRWPGRASGDLGLRAAGARFAIAKSVASGASLARSEVLSLTVHLSANTRLRRLKQLQSIARPHRRFSSSQCNAVSYSMQRSCAQLYL